MTTPAERRHPLHAVRVQIDHHSIPHIEPLRMMVHRFRHQRHPRYVPKRRHKILALEFPVQFAVHQAPSLHLLQPFLHFRITQFLRRHRLSFHPSNTSPLCTAVRVLGELANGPRVRHDPEGVGSGLSAGIPMETQARPAMWKTLLAFAIIYFVWGSTFLAIRVGVHEVPPLLFAAMRFLFAGIVLYGWMIARGERSPTARQWTSVSLLAVLIFVLDYGSLFWAEQRVPSGIAAVMLAMLMAPWLRLSGSPIDTLGAAALIFASVSWSIASTLSRKLALPASKVMSSGAQMLAGGVFLTLTAAALGEFHNFHPTTVSREVWLSLLYLIVAGSIIGFTAYVWLLHHESPTKVGTYAYVNPIVAVLVGYFLGGEPLALRTIVGTALILVSVLAITTMPAKKPAVESLLSEAQEVAGS